MRLGLHGTYVGRRLLFEEGTVDAIIQQNTERFPDEGR